MHPALTALISQHGVFLRSEAEALGYNDHAIARLVRTGVWRRVRWGVCTYGAIWDEMPPNKRYGLLCRGVVRREKTQLILSHVSSANEWATPLWEANLGAVHVTRADGRSARREAGVAPHRGRVLDGDVVKHDGLFVMSPTRTALELTTINDVEHSMVEIDDLLHRGLTTLDQLRSRYALMNHWPDTLRTDLVLQRVTDRAESVGETRLRYLCWAQNLPAPEVNYAIRDRAGKVLFRVDLAWPELGVFVEFDGKEKYLQHRRAGESIVDCVLREKRRESRIVELTGWRCVRVVWSDLYRPVETAARIEAQFRADGQRLVG